MRPQMHSLFVSFRSLDFYTPINHLLKQSEDQSCQLFILPNKAWRHSHYSLSSFSPRKEEFTQFTLKEESEFWVVLVSLWTSLMFIVVSFREPLLTSYIQFHNHRNSHTFKGAQVITERLLHKTPPHRRRHKRQRNYAVQFDYNSLSSLFASSLHAKDVPCK